MKISFAAGVLAVSFVLPLTGFFPNPETATGSPVSLKFNFKPGSKFTYTSQTVQNLDIQGHKMTQDVATSNTFAVQASQGSSKSVRLTYDRVAMKMDADGQKMNYDSQDAATSASPMAGAMGGMVGHSLVITVTSQGEVTAVQGVEELKKSVLAKNKDATLGQQLGQTLNDNTIKSSMNRLFNIYPDHAVKPGDSWTKNTTITMGPATMQSASTYTLSGVQNGVAHLLVKGKLTMAATATLTGTQSGTLDMDVATGLILSSKSKQTLASSNDAPMSIISDVTTTGHKL